MRVYSYRPEVSWYRPIFVTPNACGPGACAPAEKETAEALWVPPTDIFEGAESLIITVDLPGVAKDQVEVEIEGRALILKGQRSEPEGAPAYHHRERATGPFRRVFRVPGAYNINGTQARWAEGVLTLEIPVAPEAQARKVDIQVG